MTEKGRYALNLICKHYFIEDEAFTAAELSERAGEKVNGQVLPALVKEGYLRRLDTKPASYILIAETEEEAATHIEGLYLNIEKIKEWPLFTDYSYHKEMPHVGQLIPDKDNEKLLVKKGEKLAELQNVCIAYKENLKEEEKKQPVAKEEVKQQEEEVIFQVVEQMPEFPGGMSEAMKFLAKNIKYPVAAQQAKIEGRVIVQFVVGKDGSISDVHAVRSVSPELDAEAIRVVSMMPKWNPGKQRGKAVSVSYTMPIMFRLQSPEPKVVEAETAGYLSINLKVDKEADPGSVDMVKNILRSKYSGVPFTAVGDKSPLIVVDGKEMGTGYDAMKEIPVDQIKSISVVKSEKDAVAQYGKKAKDGVIMIVTKNNQQ